MPLSSVAHLRLRSGASGSDAWKWDVDRDRLLLYIGSGEGGKVLCRLLARELFFEDVFEYRFDTFSLVRLVRRRLTARGTSTGADGRADDPEGDDLRFLDESLGGLDRGEEREEEGGDDGTSE